MNRTKIVVLIMIAIALVLAACGGTSEPATQDVPSSPEAASEAGAVQTAPIAEDMSASEPEYSPPHSRPGPAVDKVEFTSSFVDQAVVDLEAGKIDFYTFSLKIAAAQKLQQQSEVRDFRSPASSISLLLNPAPARSGKLNPFSLPEVRRALNQLVDRGFITKDIYGGLAESMTTHVSPSDFDYITVFEALSEEKIEHDFDYAKSRISKAMQEAGAELVDEKWHYQGEPIRLKFIIRVEDERRDVGDLIRVALERVGFEVQPLYQTFAAAISRVYTSDPQSFEWHLYTEGWGRGSPDKYDFATINAMAAPWMGSMPGWQILGFWQYENAELDRLGKELFTGSFASKEERDSIYQDMTKLALEDSVRIWLATVNSTFPAKKDLTGVTEDLVAGPKSVLTLREAYLPGKESLRVGNLWVWTERSTWNPIGGFSDVYSIDIWKNLHDSPIINHPFSGLPMPFRASFEVETAGPEGKLEIPEGVKTWNATEDQWQPVPPRTEATSKVVFDYSRYFQSRWHNGEQITMADVVYEIAQNFELTYDSEKRQVEFVLAATRKPMLDTFKGFRVLDENRLEVYLDFWHFEESYIASYASPASLSLPWEILAAMDALVFEKQTAAYSQSAAARFNVPWLSLVMKKDAGLVARALKEFKRNDFLPSGMSMGLVTQEQAGNRFDATLEWFQARDHLVISQGPFMLNRFDPPAQYAELLAFRDEGYPFKPGDWYLGKSEEIRVASADIPALVKGEDLDVGVEVTGPGNLGLKYYLFDPASGEMVTRGEGEGSDSGEFRIHLDSSLTSGITSRILRLNLLAYSDEVAIIQQKKIDIIVE